MMLSTKIGAGCEPTPIPLASAPIHAVTSVSLNP
jgi:hypothetical protein